MWAPAGPSRLPGRPTARRTSCSCIHTSSGRLRSSVSVDQPIIPNTPGALADGSVARVGQQRGVAGGGGGADLVDELVGRPVAPGDDALLGERPQRAPHVLRLADLDLVVRCAGQQRLEVRGVGGDGVDVPAGEVGRRRPLLRGHLLQQRGEVVDRLPPDLDVTRQPLAVAPFARSLVRCRDAAHRGHDSWPRTARAGGWGRCGGPEARRSSLETRCGARTEPRGDQ